MPRSLTHLKNIFLSICSPSRHFPNYSPNTKIHSQFSPALFSPSLLLKLIDKFINWDVLQGFQKFLTATPRDTPLLAIEASSALSRYRSRNARPARARLPGAPARETRINQHFAAIAHNTDKWLVGMRDGVKRLRWGVQRCEIKFERGKKKEFN